jgi:signal transduction histidine kinase
MPIPRVSSGNGRTVPTRLLTAGEEDDEGRVHIVLSRDGTVLDATDGMARAWIGARLDERDDIPDEVKRAGRAAIERANGTHAASSTTPAVLSSASANVQLAVIDAIPLRRAPTDLRALLQSNLAVMIRQAETFDITLTVGVDDDVPPCVWVDAGKLAWAITALVGNAVRYVRHGSKMMPGGSIAVHVAFDSSRYRIHLQVQDDGPGIPPVKLRSLFNTDAAAGGMALGLAMIRDVVTAHGGSVAVDSDTRAFHSGTTIGLMLPVG